jgi:hypothetical protein
MPMRRVLNGSPVRCEIDGEFVRSYPRPEQSAAGDVNEKWRNAAKIHGVVPARVVALTARQPKTINARGRRWQPPTEPRESRAPFNTRGGVKQGGKRRYQLPGKYRSRGRREGQPNPGREIPPPCCPQSQREREERKTRFCLPPARPNRQETSRGRHQRRQAPPTGGVDGPGRTG